MQILTIFCIIAFTLIIASSSGSSSNILSKLQNDVNIGISVIESNIFLSIEYKAIFSSLLQPVNAQELEGHDEQQPVEEVDEQQPVEEVEETPVASVDDSNDQKLTDTKNMTASVDDKNKERNITSFNEFRNLTSASPLEDRLSIECDPTKIEMRPGEEISIDCTMENKTSDPIEIVMECSGLEGTGIECYIDQGSLVGRTLAEMSNTDFSVIIVSSSLPPVAAGSYPFVISVDECVSSDLC